MGLTNFLGGLQGLMSKDIFTILEELNGKIDSWAAATKIPAIVYLIVGMALACVIGLFGYKLIKLFMAICLGSLGYVVGAELFLAFHQHYEKLPTWCAYIAGGVIAIVFILLAYRHFSYALYTLAAFCGYLITAFYVDSMWVAIGGAILLGMISILVIRLAFVLATSLIAGALAGNFLVQILPAKLVIFQGKIGEWTPLAIMLAFAVFFFILQMATNRRRTVT